MSKKNKVVKLSSKTRETKKNGCVVYNGVEMTRAEREALIRAQMQKKEPAKEEKHNRIKKGTRVAEPRHSKLFNLLHPNKKQVVVPTLKSVDVHSNVDVKQEENPVVVEKAVEEVVNEVKPVETSKPVEVIKPVAEPVVIAQQVEEVEEDDLSAPINIHNAKKRISPNFVKRVGTVSAKSCDEFIIEDEKLAKEIEDLENSIAKLKTPKNATPEERAALNAQRKELRAQKSSLVTKRENNKEKAIALEKAADGYCDIYELLTGNELSLRKTARINEYEKLTEQEENIVLSSLWARSSRS